MLRNQVEMALERWREPDRESGRFAASRAISLLEADVLGGGRPRARLATLREDVECAERCAAAGEIQADICDNGVDNDRSVFTQHYETKALDASLLLMSLVRFLPPRTCEPQHRSRDCRRADRGRARAPLPDRGDGRRDDGEEGDVQHHSFWLVSALVEIGESAAARDLCEKLLSYAAPSFYAEQLDPRTGRHLELPAGVHHLALINALTHVIRRGRARHASLAAGDWRPWEVIRAPSQPRGVRRRSTARSPVSRSNPSALTYRSRARAGAGRRLNSTHRAASTRRRWPWGR